MTEMGEPCGMLLLLLDRFRPFLIITFLFFMKLET